MNMPRYEYETKMLAYLSSKQLNLAKNVCKPMFENMKIEEILDKLEEEIKELKEEFYKDEWSFTNIYNEVGDCGAVLSGLVAHLNDIQNKIKENIEWATEI